MINAGAAIVDITPPAGLAMAGYAARTETAIDAHDSLTVRALVVNDTALVTVDVIGIDAALSQRVRSRCMLPSDAVIIQATHTHGGPASMPGRLWANTDAAFVDQLETGIVQALEQAAGARQPARVVGGAGIDPGHAQNRRQLDGPVDRNMPILRFENADQGMPIAILTSYACHPVVLGADNLRWTGDYPHFIREELESAHPGAVALVATGCAGDVNTGHSAASSMSNESRPERSFSMAKTIGLDVARSVLDAELTELSGGADCAETFVQLGLQQREVGQAMDLAQQWRAKVEANPTAKATSGAATSTTASTTASIAASIADADHVAHIWAHWAENTMGKNIDPITARCTAFNWCGAQIVAMPGEIFARTALEIRQSLAADAPLFVLAYADDNPGYIPHRTAYSQGGYEVDEAHRFYGLGATFAPGSAERLAEASCKAARIAANVVTDVM